MENTEENNRLIAEFMGGKVVLKGNRYYQYDWQGKQRQTGSTPVTWCDTPEETLEYIYKHLLADYGRWGKFHKSWDWLMLVVKKCRTQNININNDTDRCGDIFRYVCVVDIKATHKAVVDFIKWYNANELKREEKIKEKASTP